MTITIGTGGQISDPIGSGVTLQSLIAAQTQNLQSQITPIQDQITLDNSQNAAFQTLNTLMTSFQTAAAQLSNLPGSTLAGSNQATNDAFNYVTASVAASDGTTGSNYMTVAADPGTSIGNYVFGVGSGSSKSPAITQLAQVQQQVSNAFSVANADTPIVVDDPTSGQLGAGTVVLNDTAAGGSGTTSITLNQGDTLNDVAADFNAVSNKTGIAASVVQLSDGSSPTFELQFTSTQTGAAAQFSLNPSDPKTVINSDPSGVLANVTFTNTQTAQDAMFNFDGQALTRSSNTVSDLVQGLTFTLLQPTPTGSTDTTLNVAVIPDTSTASNAISSFVNAYNNLMQFFAQQTQLNASGTYASAAVLAQNPLLINTIDTIQSALSGSVAGLPSNVLNALSQIGVTYTNIPAQTNSSGQTTTPAITNALTFDQTTLNNALEGNFSQVAAMFGISFTSSNAALTVSSVTNALSASNFTFDLDPTDNVFNATYTDASGNSQTVALTATPFSSGGGYTLTGPAGSALAGVTLLYNSTATDSNATATITNGIANTIYNLATNLTQSNTGPIAQAESGLQTKNASLNSSITQYQQQITAVTNETTAKYEAMEQAIAQADTLQETLTAETDAALASVNG